MKRSIKHKEQSRFTK